MFTTGPDAPPASDACWFMRSPLGRILTCRIYQSPIGVEVWVGYDESQPPVCSLVRDTLESAYLTAGHLKGIARDCGFSDLDSRGQ
jgi:hypothetical protein